MGRKKLDRATSAKHAQILKTASRMFIAHGYDGISMDAVAEAVPVSKRTLYNHFKDKETLFSAVMQSRCNQVFNALEQSLQDCVDASEALTRVGTQFLDVALEPDAINMYRTIITESQHFPELGKLFYESGPKRTRAILSEYLECLNDSGKLSVSNPVLASGMFIGMLLNRIQMQCLIGQKKRVTQQEKAEIVRYAVKLFLHGHTPAP